MSELLLHVDDCFALLQQQRGERVPQVVDADVAQTRFLEEPREGRPYIALFEHLPICGGEDALRHGQAFLDVPLALVAPPGEEALTRAATTCRRGAADVTSARHGCAGTLVIFDGFESGVLSVRAMPSTVERTRTNGRRVTRDLPCSIRRTAFEICRMRRPIAKP